MAFNFSSLTIDNEEFFKEKNKKCNSHEKETNTFFVTELHPYTLTSLYRYTLTSLYPYTLTSLYPYILTSLHSYILFLAISFSRFNTHSKIQNVAFKIRITCRGTNYKSFLLHYITN